MRRQATAVLDLTGASEAVRTATRVWLVVFLQCLPDDLPPSFFGRMIQRRIEDLTGTCDPYRELKDKTNRFALDLANSVRSSLTHSQDSIRHTLRLSAAANIIDFGAKRYLTIDEARNALLSASEVPLAGGFEDEVVHKLGNAESVLIIADNAGEIVFDMLLCEQLPCRPTVAVRSAPVINDVTMREAIDIGFFRHADIIEIGSDMPGLYFPNASSSLLLRMVTADVVISKGQGNYEGLSDTEFDGYFLFRVKCETVARHVGIDIGKNVLIKSRREK